MVLKNLELTEQQIYEMGSASERKRISFENDWIGDENEKRPPGEGTLTFINRVFCCLDPGVALGRFFRSRFGPLNIHCGSTSGTVVVFLSRARCLGGRASDNAELGNPGTRGRRPGFLSSFIADGPPRRVLQHALQSPSLPVRFSAAIFSISCDFFTNILQWPFWPSYVLIPAGQYSGIHSAPETAQMFGGSAQLVDVLGQTSRALSQDASSGELGAGQHRESCRGRRFGRRTRKWIQKKRLRFFPGLVESVVDLGHSRQSEQKKPFLVISGGRWQD